MSRWKIISKLITSYAFQQFSSTFLPFQNAINTIVIHKIVEANVSRWVVLWMDSYPKIKSVLNEYLFAAYKSINNLNRIVPSINKQWGNKILSKFEFIVAVVWQFYCETDQIEDIARATRVDPKYTTGEFFGGHPLEVVHVHVKWPLTKF